jgi:transcriptional regulator NrdR family protein
MKCRTCGAWSRVLDTRGVTRRRECANEHRWTTEEIEVTESHDRRAANLMGRARAILRAKGILL